MALDRFIRANDKLVKFEQELTEQVISESSVFALEVHRDELKAIWVTIKTLYEKCIDELDEEDGVENGEKTKKMQTRTQTRTDKRKDADSDSETDSDQEGSELDSINARFHKSYDTYVMLVARISSDIHSRSRTEVTSQVTSSRSSFHLPPCDTESFRGDYQSWPSFRDMFSAIYIRNSSLSKVQKLFHLRNKTKGEAFDIVNKCPLTNGGFDIAWASLQERFENKRLLVHSQLRILFNLSPVGLESGEEIKCLQRDINSCISSLELYDIDISSWDAILVYICSTKLPRTTLSLWEQSLQNKKDIPKWSALNDFLSNRFQTLETVSEINSHHNSRKSAISHSTTKPSNPSASKKINSNHAQVSSNQTTTISCNLCPYESHPIRKCPKFLSMSVDERLSCIRDLNLCINCFSRGHSIKKCKSWYNCSFCRKRHNSLLHREPIAQSNDTTPNLTSSLQSTHSNIQVESTHSAEPFNQPSTNVQSCFAVHAQNVLLGTAVVKIRHLGLEYLVRALIDSGSQGTFVSQKIFDLLKLPFHPIEAEISGLNGVTSANARKLASFSISPRYDSDLELKVKALVVPGLSGNLPTRSISPHILKNFPNLQLADPKFYESSRIDLLIGADVFNQILLDNIRRNICGSLIAQETVFGWIVTGPIQNNTNVSSYSTIVSYFTETTLEKQLKRFWEVENLPQNPLPSSADEYCEKLYSDTTSRDCDGRYIVSLPFKEPFLDKSIQLGQSRATAYAQFVRNEHRLLKIPDLKHKYDTVIQEYLDLRHMEAVASPPLDGHSENYYLPHHSVMKPESTTTKVRVVFNASCPTSSGKSLNDILYPGPVLQRDITILLLKWRFYRYVFSADIEKMYRQIKVNSRDTPFQRILFRSDPSGPIHDYELKTVTFGVNAAPFLAIRTLLQLAADSKSRFPLASEIIENDMYVDDIITGAHNMDSALVAKKQLIAALDSACFPLRKWASNSTEILSDMPKQHLLKEDFLSFEDSSQTKTLGVRWNAKSDRFIFSTNVLSHRAEYTKRQVLADIAKIFDPAGWLAPIVILAKILMRKIWLSGEGWDENISHDCLRDWKKFRDSYSMVESIQLPRWVSYSPTCKIEFHAFSDASENAYATAIYVRVLLENNSICVNLLASKSRVSPVKTLSIPKLELCGATLMAETVDSIIPSMKIPNAEIYKWTDSTIVLAWLQRPPCHWKVFVANRVSIIANKIGTDKWLHINTAYNPADLASRGVYPQDLINNSLWWHGPEWLQKPEDCWPSNANSFHDTDLEKKPVCVHMTVLPDSEDILQRFSSFNRAIRVLCYVYRFIHNTSSKYVSCNHPTRSLSTQEVLKVKNCLIMLAQKKFFPKEYQALSQKRDVPKTSSILNLNPFLDSNGLIRSLGRLVYSPSLDYDEKHPIILSYHSYFTKLLVQFTHVHVSLHGGNQEVVNLIRMQYWVPRLRNLVKSVIHSCKICVLHKKKTLSQMMAALPPERTTFHRPFYSTGIDFAGPFDIKSFIGRGSRLTKGYVCLFVCFATKAIHLELTSSLSTPVFLAAFQRFISRRGCPRHIYSDNGTNFVGASKEISRNFLEASRSGIISQFIHQNVSWHFIPPGAPHMGGLWEAGVKSFKTHFKKVSGGFKYSFEEFCTLLAKIEACLNSRPISTMSENPGDLNPLTPGHFLTGNAILAPPEPISDDRPESIVNRWQRVKVLHHHFVQRWKSEYLKELHKRNKWKQPEKNIDIDSIVVIRDENTSPNEWRIGRVTRFFPGKDNRVRVAELYTQKGVITRPIVKLVILPTQ
ncbi:uncharacterized protein LOC142231277 [Haematobia irritans]|uniref:uncharacterized protein LOC142231277 n=1 Tax=Haematobia irritans TaxID=7368 RepID=UPI003F508069